MVASNDTSIGTTTPVATNGTSLPPPTLSPPFIGGNIVEPPIVTIIIVIIWIAIVGAYFLSRWRQKPKSPYVTPRVFVLCSPRNVQFHYELILRIGLPSPDFNPDKHDIDLTVLGDRQNDTVPLTRLSTSTLLDEPIITSLSLIVYRLVEMPKIKACILKHSGPFRSWVYVYDLTVIDLSTNVENYFSINQYIGAFNKTVNLDDEKSQKGVTFPIDDIPLPQWTVEDIFIILFAVINWIMLSITILATNCGYLNDLYTVFAASASSACLLISLVWLIYYQLKWNQERSEYFNLENQRCCPWETTIRLLLIAASASIGAMAMYLALPITDIRSSAVWLLATTNTCVMILGLWNIARQVSVGKCLLNCALRMRGIENVPIGSQYSDLVGPRSLDSRSDDGLTSSTSKLIRSFGTRSSIKSYGFAPTTVLATNSKTEQHDAYTENRSQQNLSAVKSHRESSDGKATSGMQQQQDKLGKKS